MFIVLYLMRIGGSPLNGRFNSSSGDQRSVCDELKVGNRNDSVLGKDATR
jgi:hypothetical protein